MCVCVCVYAFRIDYGQDFVLHKYLSYHYYDTDNGENSVYSGMGCEAGGIHSAACSANTMNSSMLLVGIRQTIF